MLALVHGTDAAADDLGHVGGLVQGQPQQRGGQRGDQHVRRSEDQGGAAKGKPEGNHRIQGGNVVPKDQLHQQWCAAEEPDVAPADGAQDRIRRKPHDRQDRAQRDAGGHGHHREQDGQPGTGEDLRGEEVGDHDVPVVALVHRHVPRGAERHENEDDGDGQPDRVPERHHRDGVRRAADGLSGLVSGMECCCMVFTSYWAKLTRASVMALDSRPYLPSTLR